MIDQTTRKASPVIIRRVTEIPGPRSRELMARRATSVPRSAASIMPIFVRRATGAMIEDVDGNTYLDFAGGIGCLNVGSTRPEIVEAVQEQAAEFFHASFAVAPYEPYITLAERLNGLTPGTFEKRTLLVNSGAEAVENAVKVARHYTGRPAVIAFEDAFHGRTLLGLSLTSKIMPYKTGFGPFAPEIYRLPYAYCYRCAYGGCEVGCRHLAGSNGNSANVIQLPCVGGLENLFKRYVSADSVAAVIVEPVLGEGGFVAPPREFLPQVQEVCRAHGILLIADEVQTGIGRTGTLFACEQFGIEPDIILSAKSLGAGLPIAAVTGRAEIMDHPQVGGLGTTFGGNPLACRAALKALELIERERLCDRARAIGERVMNCFRELQKQHTLIGDVRGLGAMVGAELVKDRGTKEPAKSEAERFTRLACERGLIVITAGTFGNVIRTLMPLVTTDEQLDAALEIIGGVFEELD